jgi:hypothetical protein
MNIEHPTSNIERRMKKKKIIKKCSLSSLRLCHVIARRLKTDEAISL